MGWLLLWCGIGLLWLAMLAGCGWRLWRKGKALYGELRTQGHTLSELAQLLDGASHPSRATVNDKAPTT